MTSNRSPSPLVFLLTRIPSGTPSPPLPFTARSNWRDLPVPGNYRTKRTWNDMEQEQLADLAKIPLTDEHLDSLSDFDQWSARLKAEGEGDTLTKEDTLEELWDAHDQLKADLAQIEREEEKLKKLKESEADEDFKSMQEQAAKLTEGALTKGTVDTYKR